MSVYDEIEQQLHQVIDDGKITSEEKRTLKALVKALDAEKLSYLRNQAFEKAREQLLDATTEDETLTTLRWLENIIKIIDNGKNKMISVSQAHFSPGSECRHALLNLCQQAKTSIDVCVYTISDNHLSEAIIAAHQRGIAVRVITDNAKSEDLGSDIDLLQEKNVPLVMDVSKYHMHHKFAIFDNTYLANGSFNWTRSATTSNEENIVVANEPHLIQRFKEKFDELWDEYH